MKKSLFLLVLIAGCYEPTYTTSQGVDVFCHYGEEVCHDQAELEFGLEFFAGKADQYFEWPEAEVRHLYRRSRIFFVQDPIPCYQSPEKGCAGTIQGNGIGSDIKLHYTGSLPNSAFIHEFSKFGIIRAEGTLSYESLLWLAASVLKQEFEDVYEEAESTNQTGQ